MCAPTASTGNRSTSCDTSHVELLRSAIFLEREDTTPYVTAAARVETVALGATESLRLITERAKELEGKT